MKIHTNLMHSQMLSIRPEGVYFERLNEAGSRSRDRAFDVILSGSSNRRGAFGGDYDAATWDEWGIFIQNIFNLDPEAKMSYYKDADDFAFQTNDRFKTLTVADQCPNHKWDFSGPSATGSYFKCNKCDAITRLTVRTVTASVLSD